MIKFLAEAVGFVDLPCRSIFSREPRCLPGGLGLCAQALCAPWDFRPRRPVEPVTPPRAWEGGQS